MTFIYVVAAVVVACVVWGFVKKVLANKAMLEAIEARKKSLLIKYDNNAEVVNLIMQRSFWVGQTADQLHDSLGYPEDIDEKVMKNKVRRVWKYQRTGANRYRIRITLEDNIVTGWDHK